MRDASQWLVERGGPAPLDLPPPSADRDEDVAAAVTYARRATAQAPKSERRLREAMSRKGFDLDTIDAAIDRCREDGTIDDPSFARTLVKEWRSKGHAPPRMRNDLRERGFDDELIIEVLERTEADDDAPDAETAAFDIALRRAERLRTVPMEAAFRRIVGYLTRRGHNDAVARKVARLALFTDREPQRVAER